MAGSMAVEGAVAAALIVEAVGEAARAVRDTIPEMDEVALDGAGTMIVAVEGAAAVETEEARAVTARAAARVVVTDAVDSRRRRAHAREPTRRMAIPNDGAKKGVQQHANRQATHGLGTGLAGSTE